MDDIKSKHYLNALIISIIILVFWIISFFLSELKYYLYIYKIKKLEENDPFIDLSGIQSFSFDKTDSNNPEYNSQVPNLGYTGELIFDCYKGSCKYYREYQCEIECDEDESCFTKTTTCESYPNYFEYDSSNLCRNTDGEKCNACPKYKNHTYIKCSCSHSNNTNYYSNGFSCYADNIIYNWKNLTYNRKNQTFSNFNYSKNAVPSNENCPSNMHQCGILDEFGNKLCYPIGKNCPINYITLNSSDKNYNYQEYTIDGVKIYYTNEAIEDGKVLGGFYVDSDLMIKYNIGECQIIDTSKISELLNSHKNKLYRNNLKFDPYKDKDIDKKGKAYLKWCIPGVGKERNITLIKKLNIDYELNKTTNKNITNFTKNIKINYFIGLPGYIIVTILLSITIFLIIIRKFIAGCTSGIIFFNVLVLVSSISSRVSHSELSDVNKSNFYKNIFNIIIRLNIAIFWMNISFTIFFIFFSCYLCYINEIDFFHGSKKEKNNYKSLEDKNAMELQKKYDNDSEQNNNSPYDQSSNPFPLIPKGIN